MSLKSISALSGEASDDELVRFLKRWENAPLVGKTARTEAGGIHDDGAGNPTIGYGLNLKSLSYVQIEKALTYAITGSTKGKLTSSQKAGLKIIEKWKKGTLSLGKDDDRVLLDLAGTKSKADPASKKALDALNLKDAEAARLLKAYVFGLNGLFASSEAGLERKLMGYGATLPEPSLERVVLNSLYYNSPKLIGPGVAAALKTDNHALLWYEIRYNHLNYAHKGIQNRREAESNLIDILAPQDRKDAGKVLESLGTLFGAAVYDKIATRDAAINKADPKAAAKESFEARIDGYMTVLEKAYANGNELHFVQVGTNRADTIKAGAARHLKLSESSTNDLIFAGGGNDIISSGGGNDWVYGGLGSDRLDLGSGNDFGQGGAGNDTILGGAGDDILVADAGTDWLWGGSGSDAFVLTGLGKSSGEARAWIMDFQQGQDVIDLRSYGKLPVIYVGFGAALTNAQVDTSKGAHIRIDYGNPARDPAAHDFAGMTSATHVGVSVGGSYSEALVRNVALGLGDFLLA